MRFALAYKVVSLDLFLLPTSLLAAVHRSLYVCYGQHVAMPARIAHVRTFTSLSTTADRFAH